MRFASSYKLGAFHEIQHDVCNRLDMQAAVLCFSPAERAEFCELVARIAATAYGKIAAGIGAAFDSFLYVTHYAQKFRISENAAPCVSANIPPYKLSVSWMELPQ